MENTKNDGRIGISESVYINQIQSWLDAGEALSNIKVTNLQKSVGGRHKKAAEILEKFKLGYESKELSDLPEVPESLYNALQSVGLEAWRILYDEKNKAIAEATEDFNVERVKLEAANTDYLDVIDSLEIEINELKMSLKNNEQYTKELEVDKNKINLHLAESSERVEQQQTRLVDAKDQNDKLTLANENLQATNINILSQIDALKESLSKVTHKSESLEKELVSSNKELENEQKNTKTLELNIKSLKSEKENVDQQLAIANSNQSALDKSLLEQSNKISHLEDSISSLNKELGSESALLLEREKTNKSLNLEIKILKDDLHKSQATIDIQVKELNEAHDNLSNSKVTIATQKSEIDSAIKTAKETKERADCLQSELLKLASS